MSDAFTGQIQTFGFSFAPVHWALCGGQTIAISQNQALYALIGTFYGGDGRTSMAVPNFTSRCAIGFNMGGGIGLTTYQIGTKFGFQNTVLTHNQLPVHTHTATFVASGGGSSAVLSATTEDGESATPSNGSYLAKTVSGPSGADVDEKIYRNTTPTAGSLVELGGVSGGGSGGGTVVVANSGASSSVDLQNPFTAINFSLCMEGIFPSRN